MVNLWNLQGLASRFHRFTICQVNLWNLQGLASNGLWNKIIKYLKIAAIYDIAKMCLKAAAHHQLKEIAAINPVARARQRWEKELKLWVKSTGCILREGEEEGSKEGDIRYLPETLTYESMVNLWKDEWWTCGRERILGARRGR